MIRVLVHFSGRVQGVGFRATTRQIARGYTVSGTVRNLDDGRVELIAEGEMDQLDALVGDILNFFGSNVNNHTIERRTAQGGFASGLRIMP